MSNEHVRPGSQVFEVKCWMMHWGSDSPKRTVFMGNLVAHDCSQSGQAYEFRKKEEAQSENNPYLIPNLMDVVKAYCHFIYGLGGLA